MTEHLRAPALDAAYAECRAKARHYENFPVGSLLFPRRLRDHFHAVYAFARAADDFADEGTLPQEQRLQLLHQHEQDLIGASTGVATDPLFIALGDTMHRFEMPIEPFQKLLSAFRQDVTTTRYETFDDVRDYCSRSADPVGEIVLRLFHQFNPDTAPLSASICTALQLANFWQDVVADFAKGRVYIPQCDLREFEVDESVIPKRNPTSEFRQLMKFEISRTAGLFNSGAPLVSALHGRLRREIAAVLASGRGVLQKIERNDFDVLTKSNRLLSLTQVWILVRAAIAPLA